MKKKIIIFVALLMCFLPVFTGCGDEFKECSSSLLDLSQNNFTIEINDGSKYDGIYMADGNVMKKMASNRVYYYFQNDAYRYYREVNSWSRTNDQGDFKRSLSIVKDFFESSRTLLKNNDGTIFKTKTGNKIYNIGTTKLITDEHDFSLKDLEIDDLTTSTKYIFTQSALVISKSSSELSMYIKKSNEIKKFSYVNSSWDKRTSEIADIDEYRENVLSRIGENFVLESGMYLSDKFYSVKEYTSSLFSSKPNTTDYTYTVKNFADNYVYAVTKNFIKVTCNDNFVSAYHLVETGRNGNDDVIYEYSNNNYNGYITKEVTTKFKKWSEIMQDITNDFAFLYGNTLRSSYIIIGQNTEYVLSRYGSTTLPVMEEEAYRIDDITDYLESHSYTLRDKRIDTIYTVTENIIHIIDQRTSEEKYFSLENNKVYCYTLSENGWEKSETTYNRLKDVLDFEKLYSEINESNILKLADSIMNIDFVSENFVITNYDKDIPVQLPEV